MTKYNNGGYIDSGYQVKEWFRAEPCLTLDQWRAHIKALNDEDDE